jgi:hypothetical protein
MKEKWVEIFPQQSTNFIGLKPITSKKNPSGEMVGYLFKFKIIIIIEAICNWKCDIE